MPLYTPPPSGSSAAQPQVGVDYRHMAWHADALTTALIASGTAALTPTGTASALNATTSTVAAPIVIQTTSTTSGNAAGWTNGQQIRPNGATIDLNYRVVSDTLSGSMRYWVGIFGATPSASDNPTSVTGYGFVASSGLGTNWYAWTGNGTASTSVDTGVGAFAASGNVRTISQLRIVVNPATPSIAFYVNGALKTTITTTIPALTGGTHNTFVQVTTLSAAARGLGVSRIGYNLYW